MNEYEKAIKQIEDYGLDNLDELISSNSLIESCDLHNKLYNEDYFIIYTYNAEKFLEEYGTFVAIRLVQGYEKDNFGEVNTDLSSPEKVANMVAYIEGEKFLNKSKHLMSNFDKKLNEDDLKIIKVELKKERI